MRGDREHGEHDDLDRQQHLLDVGRDLDADVADPGHQDDPDDADEQDPATRRVATDAVCADEQEEVLPGNLREAGHDQDVGGENAPATHPAGLRPEGLGTPGERCATVGLASVQFLVSERDEEDRDERENDDDDRLGAGQHGHEAQRRREAVGRRGRGDADDDARDEAERTALEPLVEHFPVVVVDLRRVGDHEHLGKRCGRIDGTSGFEPSGYRTDFVG